MCGVCVCGVYVYVCGVCGVWMYVVCVCVMCVVGGVCMCSVYVCVVCVCMWCVCGVYVCVCGMFRLEDWARRPNTVSEDKQILKVYLFISIIE
jgi:hypothetical protein